MNIFVVRVTEESGFEAVDVTTTPLRQVCLPGFTGPNGGLITYNGPLAQVDAWAAQYGLKVEKFVIDASLNEGLVWITKKGGKP